MSDEEKINLNDNLDELSENSSTQEGEQSLKRRKKKKRKKKKKKNFIGLIIIFLLLIAVIGGVGFLISSMSNKSVIDNEYKQALLVGLGQQNGDVKKLESIVGEEEFKLIVDKYNNNPKAYQIDERVKGDKKYVENLTHRINLNTTTKISEGSISVEELLNQAASYADKVKAKNPKEKYPYVIALTDYSKVEQDKIALKTIYENPEKYKNLKVVLGVQFWVNLKAGEVPSIKDTGYVEMSGYCINPYDKAYNILAYINYPFMDVVKIMQTQKYGVMAINNPVVSFGDWMMVEGKGREAWNSELLNYYSSQVKKTPLLVDTYTQSIALDKWYQEQTKILIKEIDKKGMKKIGGTHTRLNNIFE